LNDKCYLNTTTTIKSLSQPIQLQTLNIKSTLLSKKQNQYFFHFLQDCHLKKQIEDLFYIYKDLFILKCSIKNNFILISRTFVLE